MTIQVEKDETMQKCIPNKWRDTIWSIVEFFVKKDISLLDDLGSVCEISPELAQQIFSSIERYGVHLISLPSDTWKTSACQWMLDYWDVLIDLYSQEGASDLALSIRVYESEVGYKFDIQSVYVP